MKTRLAVVVFVAAATLITGCQSGSDSFKSVDKGSYCLDIDALSANFRNPDFGGISDDTFSNMLESFETIQAAAPADIADDWQTVIDGYQDLRQSLTAAGLTFDDLRTVADGGTVPGLTEAGLTQLAKEMAAITQDSSMNAAHQVVAENVQSVCDVTLNV